jgi:hypothetical protein
MSRLAKSEARSSRRTLGGHMRSMCPDKVHLVMRSGRHIVTTAHIGRDSPETLHNNRVTKDFRRRDNPYTVPAIARDTARHTPPP